MDEKAIGIQGHSWGGYQIAYMVTQTNRFKAAAAGAPVVEHGQRLRRHPLGHRPAAAVPVRADAEPHRRHALGVPDAVHRELADVLEPTACRRRVMILHNDDDDAVPWYQGIEYFLALRRLGKEATCSTTTASRTACATAPTRRTTRSGCSSSSTTT